MAGTEENKTLIPNFQNSMKNCRKADNKWKTIILELSLGKIQSYAKIFLQ